MFKLKPKILIGLLISAVIALNFPLKTDAAIGVGNVSSAKNATDGTSLSWSHDAGSGTDRVLVVGISRRGSGGATASVTYNSVSMTQAVSSCTSFNECSWVFYLVDPASGSNTVAATVTSGGLAGGAITITGADTADPLDATGTNNGNSGTSDVTVTTIDDNTIVVGNLVIAAALDPTCADTHRWEQINSEVSNTMTGAGCTISQVTAGSAVVNWTHTSDRWATAGLSINEAPPAVATGGDKTEDDDAFQMLELGGMF